MKLKRKLLTGFLSLALICLLFPMLQRPANAANATSVTIQGVTLSTGQYMNENGTVSTSKPSSGGYVQFTSGGSLSMHDFSLGISGVRGISANGNLSIYLYGSNYIRTNTNHYAIYADGNIYIYGMDNGKLMAYSDQACAIYAAGSITLNSGDVEAVSYGSNVLNAQSSVLIKGGTLEVIGTASGYPAIWAKSSIQISGGVTTVTTPATAINCSSGYVSFTGGRVTASSGANNGVYANSSVTLGNAITDLSGGLHGIRAGSCKVTGGYHKVTSTNTEKDSSYSAFSPSDGDKTKFVVDSGVTAVGSDAATNGNMVKVETTNLFNYDRLECGDYVKVKGIPLPVGWYLEKNGTQAVYGSEPDTQFARLSSNYLYLNNFTCTTSSVGIESEQAISIHLTGSNSFSTGNALALDVDGKVTISEGSSGGSLALNGNSHLVKITGELQLDEGTVTCVGGGNTVELGALNIDDGMLTITSTNVGLWVRGDVTVDVGTLVVTASGSNGAYIEGNLKLNSGAANISSTGSIGCYVKGSATVSDGNHSVVGYTDGLNSASLSVTGGFLKARSTTTSNDGSYCALQVPADSFSVSTALSAAADGSNTTMPQVRLNSAALSTYDSVTIGNFVYVNGVEVCSGQYLANGGTKTSPNQPSGGYAYLSGATLILNNYSCSTSGTSAVKAFRDLTISLLGTNSLAGNSTVILSYGALEIKNSGSLTVNTSDYNAIYSTGKMTLSANVTATTNIGYALRSDDALLVTGGKVLAQSQSSKGAYAKGTISCAGGELTAVGNIGIESETSVNVSGGTVNVTGNQYGINSTGNVVVNSGGILAVNVSNGIGIQSTGKLLLNGGATTVTATNHGVSAVGLTAGNTASLLSQSTGGKALNLSDTGSGKYSLGNNLTATASTYSDGSKGGVFRLEDVDTYRYVNIRPNTLKIAGISMTSGTYLASWETATQTSKPSGGYAYYNNGVLTLNGFEHSSKTGKVLEAVGSLKIEMIGAISLSTESGYAAYVDGILEIVGDGNVTLYSVNETALYVTHGLTVTSGEVRAISGAQQAIRITMGDLTVAGGELASESRAKSSTNVNGTTYITGGFASFSGYLNGLSTGKFSITGGEAYIGSTKHDDSWEALYLTQSGSNAFFMAGNVEATASAYTYLENEVMFDIKNIASYNSVRFWATTVWIGGVELPDGMYLASGSSTPVSTEPAGGYAYFKDRDLTLYNYDDTDCMDYGIRCNRSLDIEVIGANHLYGSIDVAGDLTLVGTGKLDIIVPNCGLQAGGNIDLFGLTLDIKTSSEDSVAINAVYTLSLSEAHVDVICNTVDGAAVVANFFLNYASSLTIDSAGHGVFSTKGFTVTGGVINIEADLSGIRCGALELEFGELTVVAVENGMEVNSFNMAKGTLSVMSCNADNSYSAIALGAPEFTLGSELIMRGCETTYGTLREITRDEVSSMDRIEISNHVCTLLHMPEVPTACEAEGKQGYYYCTCGRYFQDGEGQLPIDNIDAWGILPATGHDFTAIGYNDTWHWNYCAICGDEDTESYGTHDIVDGSCYLCGYIRGFSVSGKLVTFGNAEDMITLRLLKDGAEYLMMSADGDVTNYSFDFVAPGEYILEISKKNHVTREYKISVADGSVTQDVKIYLIGDVTSDGVVDIADTARVYSHVRKTAQITDEYLLKVADVSGDGEINVDDTAKIYSHVRKTSLLW